MGTNFYLMSRNKKLMREHFAVETEYGIKNIEYAIVDEPYLGYEVNITVRRSRQSGVARATCPD